MFNSNRKTARRRGLICYACLGLALVATPSLPAFAQSTNFDLTGRALYDRLIEAANSPQADSLKPVVRIVSPLADSVIAPGIARPRNGSFDGTGFVLNIEVVTRDQIGFAAREATMAPPVFGIRHVPELDKGLRNPDVPRLFVFFDKPLITPGGAILPAFNNFAAAFNVAGTDDTPGKGITTWLGWHVLESLPPQAQNVTVTVAAVDRAGRVAYDRITLKVDRSRKSGQELTPFPETFQRSASTVDDGRGPEVSLIAPRVPTAIAVGPQDGLTPDNGSLFFIHLSAVDRNRNGIAVSETGLNAAGQATTPFPTGLIFDPTAIPAGRANQHIPGMTVSFDVPLRQPNGNVVPAGANLAGLFDVAGSEIDATGAVRTTADWVVGGALILPEGKRSVTINASVTDNAGHTGTTKAIVAVSDAVSGQDLTPNP